MMLQNRQHNGCNTSVMGPLSHFWRREIQRGWLKAAGRTVRSGEAFNKNGPRCRKHNQGCDWQFCGGEGEEVGGQVTQGGVATGFIRPGHLLRPQNSSDLLWQRSSMPQKSRRKLKSARHLSSFWNCPFVITVVWETQDGMNFSLKAASLYRGLPMATAAPHCSGCCCTQGLPRFSGFHFVTHHYRGMQQGSPQPRDCTLYSSGEGKGGKRTCGAALWGAPTCMVQWWGLEPHAHSPGGACSKGKAGGPGGHHPQCAVPVHTAPGS